MFFTLLEAEYEHSISQSLCGNNTLSNLYNGKFELISCMILPVDFILLLAYNDF